MLHEKLTPPETKGHLSVARLARFWYVACQSAELQGPTARARRARCAARAFSRGRTARRQPCSIAAPIATCRCRSAVWLQVGDSSVRTTGGNSRAAGAASTSPGCSAATARSAALPPPPYANETASFGFTRELDHEPDAEPFSLPATAPTTRASCASWRPNPRCTRPSKMRSMSRTPRSYTEGYFAVASRTRSARPCAASPIASRRNTTASRDRPAWPDACSRRRRYGRALGIASSCRRSRRSNTDSEPTCIPRHFAMHARDRFSYSHVGSRRNSKTRLPRARRGARFGAVRAAHLRPRRRASCAPRLTTFADLAASSINRPSSIFSVRTFGGC